MNQFTATQLELQKNVTVEPAETAKEKPAGNQPRPGQSPNPGNQPSGTKQGGQ
jgi:hypothetical protein